MERRLAAILAADVVGYSRLVGADEAGALDALRACERDLIEPAVDRYGGRIFKRLGDGYLVEFSSVVSCTACALDWQTGASAPLSFRMGIHLGDVLVEGEDLLGDGVNIAARLEAIAEPGGIWLSDDARRQLRGKLDLDLRDMGEQTLKNIAEPIRVFAAAPRGAPPVAAQDAANWNDPRLLLVPFEARGGESEMLAAGITDRLAQALAAFDYLDLIDPGVATKGLAAEGPVATGRRLGARFIVEGSIQAQGTRARVRVSMMDPSSGRRAWSDSFDRAVEDPFALEDEITAIVASVVGEAVESELAKAIHGKPDSALTPEERCLRGMEHLHRMTPDDNLIARRLFSDLIDGGATNPRAAIGYCYTYQLEIMHGWPATRTDRVQHCFDILGEVQGTHDRSPTLHRLLARLHETAGDVEKARAHFERAAALNPWDSDILFGRAGFELRHGSVERAVEMAERALRINPYAPTYYRAYLAFFLFLAGRPEDGLACLAALDTSVGPSRVARMLNLVALGRPDAARAEVPALLAENPAFTIAGLLRGYALEHRPDLATRIRDALTTIGLPEDT